MQWALRPLLPAGARPDQSELWALADAASKLPGEKHLLPLVRAAMKVPCSPGGAARRRTASMMCSGQRRWSSPAATTASRAAGARGRGRAVPARRSVAHARSASAVASGARAVDAQAAALLFLRQRFARRIRVSNSEREVSPETQNGFSLEVQEQLLSNISESERRLVALVAPLPQGGARESRRSSPARRLASSAPWTRTWASKSARRRRTTMEGVASRRWRTSRRRSPRQRQQQHAALHHHACTARRPRRAARRPRRRHGGGRGRGGGQGAQAPARRACCRWLLVAADGSVSSEWCRRQRRRRFAAAAGAAAVLAAAAAAAPAAAASSSATEAELGGACAETRAGAHADGRGARRRLVLSSAAPAFQQAPRQARNKTTSRATAAAIALLLALRNMGGESEAAWRGSSTTWSPVGWQCPSWSSSTARQVWKRPLPPCGTTCRATLYGAQAPQPAGPCAEDALRRDQRRLRRHDLRHERKGGGCQAQGVPAQMAPALPRVAASLEEAGDQLFTFLRFPQSQWKSIRTTNAIERLHEEFKRRIKTQCVLPCADTAACCSGRYWPPARSPYAKLTAGRPWLRSPPRPSRLTSPPNRSQPHHAGDHPLRPFPHNPRRHLGCTLQCALGGIGDGRCYFANARAKPQLIDDLVPLPRLRQNAQSDVAHLGLPCVEACGYGGGQASRKSVAALTQRLPASGGLQEPWPKLLNFLVGASRTRT